MHRVLRNDTVSNWEAEGCPLDGDRPGENDVVAEHPEYGPSLRYDMMSPHAGHEGKLEDMALYAGEGVGRVNNVPGAMELIESLWVEIETARSGGR